jgi:hypothetical protein
VIPLKGFLYVLGGVLAIVAAIFVYTHVDDWKRARYDAKSVSAAAHGDTAAAFVAVADTTHAQGVVIRDNWRVLTSSSEVKRNPVAVKVAEKGNQVIANADKETSALRSANAQLSSQVHDLKREASRPRLERFRTSNLCTHSGARADRRHCYGSAWTTVCCPM